MIRYHRRFIDPKNQYRFWIDPRIRTLRLVDVMEYLTRRGWAQVCLGSTGFPDLSRAARPEEEGGPYCQFVPDSEEGSDYPLRMFELLTGLAEYERRQAAAVIDDILGHAEPKSPNGAVGEQSHPSGVVRK